MSFYKVTEQESNHKDLEKKVIKDIEYAATRLGGTIQKISKHDYMGRSSKIIQIEYNGQVLMILQPGQVNKLITKIFQDQVEMKKLAPF